ncbi:unnamed protein product [Brassica rapa subsp. narinosa]
MMKLRKVTGKKKLKNRFKGFLVFFIASTSKNSLCDFVAF